jgi:2-methylaconitate cis-trans-isomerase PrpF
MGQQKISCCIMRGGTSKGIFFHEHDLPLDQADRDRLVLKVFGSPDIRQIDGLGGADPLTSKMAIIGPSGHSDADVDYTFGQVSIGQPLVDYSGNCGNISSAVGPFAIAEGLVPAVEPVTKVRIYNKNTGKILIAEVPVSGDSVQAEGLYSIDGVPGTGAKILMDFAGTAGAITGKMLPTGNPRDLLHVKGVGSLEASIVDVGNPVVFVRAKDLGLKGIETPSEIDGNPVMLETLERIRSLAAVMIGMAASPAEATSKFPAFPMIAFVSPPRDYQTFNTGKTVHRPDVDLVSRLMYMQVMHKTYAGTGTTSTGAAARIPGSIVNEACTGDSPVIRIGHPAGVIEIEVGMTSENGLVTLKRAAFGRTARRIMDGHVYVASD